MNERLAKRSLPRWLAAIWLAMCVSLPGQSTTKTSADFTREAIVTVRRLLDLFYTTHARWPQSWEELTRKDDTGRSYIDSVPRDGWQRELRLLPSLLSRRVVLVSDGPDGKPDTSDDIDSELLETQPAAVLYALTDLAGKRLDGKLVKGRLVIVHFWSSLCLQEAGALNELAAIAKAHPDDVSVITVASHAPEIGAEPVDWELFATKDEAKRPYPELRAAAQQQQLGVVLVDHRGFAARYFKATTTTHCVVLDRAAKVVYSGAVLEPSAGGDPPRQAARAAVEAVLAGKSPGGRQPQAAAMPLQLAPRVSTAAK